MPVTVTFMSWNLSNLSVSPGDTLNSELEVKHLQSICAAIKLAGANGCSADVVGFVEISSGGAQTYVNILAQHLNGMQGNAGVWQGFASAQQDGLKRHEQSAFLVRIQPDVLALDTTVCPGPAFTQGVPTPDAFGVLGNATFGQSLLTAAVNQTFVMKNPGKGYRVQPAAWATVDAGGTLPWNSSSVNLTTNQVATFGSALHTYDILRFTADRDRFPFGLCLLAGQSRQKLTVYEYHAPEPGAPDVGAAINILALNPFAQNATNFILMGDFNTMNPFQKSAARARVYARTNNGANTTFKEASPPVWQQAFAPFLSPPNGTGTGQSLFDDTVLTSLRKGPFQMDATSPETYSEPYDRILLASSSQQQPTSDGANVMDFITLMSTPNLAQYEEAFVVNQLKIFTVVCGVDWFKKKMPTTPRSQIDIASDIDDVQNGMQQSGIMKKTISKRTAGLKADKRQKQQLKSLDQELSYTLTYPTYQQMQTNTFLNGQALNPAVAPNCPALAAMLYANTMSDHMPVYGTVTFQA